jgi:hypothetical protein
MGYKRKSEQVGENTEIYRNINLPHKTNRDTDTKRFMQDFMINMLMKKRRD